MEHWTSSRCFLTDGIIKTTCVEITSTNHRAPNKNQRRCSSSSAPSGAWVLALRNLLSSHPLTWLACNKGNLHCSCHDRRLIKTYSLANNSQRITDFSLPQISGEILFTSAALPHIGDLDVIEKNLEGEGKSQTAETTRTDKEQRKLTTTATTDW